MGRVSNMAAIGALLLAIPVSSIQAKTESLSQKFPSDPNERVCEDIKVIGSRLAVKRVCGTRAEWKIKRQQDREVVDEAQRHAADPCNSILTHTGPATC
jgi:hypothetical protein